MKGKRGGAKSQELVFTAKQIEEVEMEAVSPVIEVVKCVCSPAVRYVGYAKNLKKNFEKLDKMARDLYDRRADIQMLVRNTAGAGKIPSFRCETWLKDVADIEKQMVEMKKKYEQEKKCFKGFCPNVYSRMMFGKHVEVKFEEVSKLVNTFTSDEGVLVDAPVRLVEMVPSPRVEVDSSTARTVQKILEHLRDGRKQRIGVWGMGGVGKTTVMKMVNNLPEISQMFAVVIWVTVSGDWSIRKVQNEIATRLNIKLEENVSNDAVSRKLFEKLENTKYLLLLDDVWDKVDLEDVGVPAPSSENGCKVLLTSRSQGVCNKMETDVEVPVEVLSEEEAWKLFREKVTDVIELHEIKPLAEGVIRECGGLPLAVIVVGGALRKETNIHVWQNALNELRMAATSHIEDMEEKVFKRLKFSYDRLKDDNMKNCFLYGALFPEDYEIKIDELIEYWRAEGFIEGASNLEEARSKGHTILKYLMDASLLERGGSTWDRYDGSLLMKFGVYHPRRECVKMHDVIRDLALRITSHGGGEGRIYLARAGTKLEEPPKEQAEWKRANVISLMHNNLCLLPESVDCPVLTTLFLQRNNQLKAIPESFLEGMPALRVLDLSGTSIKQLPQSLCRLKNLRGLYLRKCSLLFTLPPEIGSLKSLEVLVVKGIRYLPIEIGELGRLQHLRASFSCDRDDDTEHEVQKMIPDEVISRLTHLEDLRIAIDMEDERWNEIVEAVTEEIGALKELCRLYFCFASVENLKHFINISQSWNSGLLKSFRFAVSRPIRRDQSTMVIDAPLPSQLDRWLMFKNCNTILDVPVQVFRRADSFIFWNCTAFEKLEQLGEENLSGLKYFLIRNCDFGQTLIGGGCKLPNLEQLRIVESSNMLNIWECNSSLTPLLGNLRVLSVQHCSKLKYVFPRGVFPHVPNLEQVLVSGCEDVEQIIVGEVTNNTLQKLNSIWLDGLGKLDCICEGVISWPLLDDVDIYGCEKLRRLPFGTDSAPSLKAIRCRKEWWDSLEWEDNATRYRFQSLAQFP